MRIQRRLLLALLALLLGVVGIAAIVVSRDVNAGARELVSQHLAAEARILAAELETPPGDLIAWVARVHAAADAEVTVIGDEGRSRAHSSADGSSASANPSGQPEVAAAFAGRVSSAVRRSPAGGDLSCVAQPIGAPPRLVLELCAPLDGAAQLAHSAQGAVLLAGLLALALAFGLASFTARRLSRPLAAVTRAARSIGQGDYDSPLPPASDDELGDLMLALETLRGQLAVHLEGLNGENEKLRTILDGMTEGVALIEDGTITAANPAFGALLGLSGAAAGRTLLDVARSPEVIEAVARPGPEREVLLGARWLRIEAHRLAGGGQQVLVLRDVTEPRRLERMRRDFVANASHELRTPVAAIVGATETLSAGAAEDPAARRSFLGILERHAARLSRLTQDLLDLARVEAGWRPLVEQVPVDAAIGAVVAALLPRAQERSIALTAGAPGGLAVAAERAAVEQILTNLVENAIKYTPERGQVRVTAQAQGGRVELFVEDTGPGIAAQHLPRLFERFYRVDAARSRELGGTGLGLAIVKHLALAHGGDVRVESQLGKGSRFIVSLPHGREFAKSSQTDAADSLKWSRD